MAKTPQTRKEATSVRLEPKIKYLVEVAARIQRRSVTNYIEWALEESLKDINISVDDKELNLLEAADLVWSTNEVERFIALAINFNDLLTFDEQKLWELIQRYPRAFTYALKTPSSNIEKITNKDIDPSKVINLWDILNKAKDGDISSLIELDSLHVDGLTFAANDNLKLISDSSSTMIEKLKSIVVETKQEHEGDVIDTSGLEEVIAILSEIKESATSTMSKIQPAIQMIKGNESN